MDPSWITAEVARLLPVDMDKSLPPVDPRTADWPLLGEIWQPLSIAGAYLAMVFIGPKLMAPFKPFQLRVTLVIYNLFLTLLSLYMCVEFVLSVIDGGLNWGCSAVDYAPTAAATRLARVCWVYYVSKVVEFFDTLFFILRKKQEQISFLHVYHHVTMFIWWWLVTKRYAGGSVYFGAMMNSGVHVIMYFYYMLAAFGPAVRPYLWWKKYLTSIQMMQFLIVIGHNHYVAYSDCGFSVPLAYCLTAYMWSLFALFYDFYRKSYRRTSKERPDGSHAVSASQNGASNGAGKKHQ
ncbi:very long chain fatty acid elongase 4-like [Sycon ciliatum]|uniref:very long chain fatty acid elongase 4-like n=1 Tax=Sycon ciliatum TaxID=27933 RepID=UPI0020AAC960|eukprot:scpid81243/ scgid33492/ Elongation of very long chain fatty acids protein 4; 3-keto acyl-CoA synthase Elovl4; ELOVL fatty acid elongase 4